MLGFSSPTDFFVGYSPSYLYQLPGIGWSMEESPAFNTLDEKTAGGREVMNQMYQNPLHSWKLKLNFLENDLSYDLTGATSTQYQNLYSFYCAQSGRFGEFLYKTRDAAVTKQFLAAPDSNGYTEITFNLGPFFTESVQELNGATPTIYSYNTGTGIYTDRTLDCTFYAAASVSPYTGIVFTSSYTLGSGEQWAWSGTWFYRCHFDKDSYTFEEFMYKLLKTGIGLEQVRI